MHLVVKDIVKLDSAGTANDFLVFLREGLLFAGLTGGGHRGSSIHY